MNTFAATFRSLFDDSGSMMTATLVFLAAGTLAFSLMAFVRVRGAVKKRASRMMMDGRERQSDAKRSLRYSSFKAVTQLIEYTTKHYSTANDGNMKVLRQRLVQAGIYDPRGVAMFFLVPDFYASVWDNSLTKIGLGAAAFWMGIGNFIMYRLVNFKI
ncbi:MAG TPA: hypothetical protein VE224_16535 [Pseudolabrys sp.]|nr:hypothetical protein [Pseudolabrys sp.]